MKNYHNFLKILEHHYQESKEDTIDSCQKDKNQNKIEVSISALQIIQIIIKKDIKTLDKNKINKFSIPTNQLIVIILVIKIFLNSSDLQKIM